MLGLVGKDFEAERHVVCAAPDQVESNESFISLIQLHGTKERMLLSRHLPQVVGQVLLVYLQGVGIFGKRGDVLIDGPGGSPPHFLAELRTGRLDLLL